MFWTLSSGQVRFSGIENKNEGQRMATVGKEKWCEEVKRLRGALAQRQ